MGSYLNLPLDLRVIGVIALFLVLLVAQRRFERRAARRRSEEELLRFCNLQLLASKLSAGSDPNEMVDQALDGTLDALGLSDGCVVLHICGPHATNYCTARGISAGARRRIADDPLRSYLTSAGGRWGALMVFPDLLRPELMAAWHRDPLFHEFREVFSAERLRTLVVVGLQTRENGYGLLAVGSREVRRFRPGELRLMLALGNQISVALENRLLQKAAERHNEELEILHRISEALSATFHLEKQLQILQHELGQWLGTAYFSMAFQESPSGRLETFTVPEEGGREAAKLRQPADGLSEYVSRTGAPLLIAQDFLHTARQLGIASIDPRMRTWCGVPIHFSDSSRGVLAVADFEREQALDERDFRLLQVLAREAAVAIENARLFQREQRRVRHLGLLNELGRKATSVLDPQELVANICRQVQSAFGYDLVRLHTLDRERGELVVDAQEGYRASVVGHRSKLGEGLEGAAAESGEAVLVNHVEEDARYLPLHPGVRSALSLPLKYRDETLGVLSLESLHTDSFSPQDVVTLQTLADQLAIALHNARAYQGAQDQAITDGLTGLKTHRFFMEALESEWRRAPRVRRPFSLIMMDLDGFKRVNDRYGHLEGDRVLTAVAGALAGRSRQSNMVARYGGDEFAVLMPEGSLEQAELLAERLRASLAADAYLAARGVTASFGIATFPMHGATPDEILRVADAGMYLAKHEKGNRVRVASGSSSAALPDLEQQLIEAYLGVAVKRMFSTGPEAFNQYLERLREAQDSNGESLPLMDTVTALAFAIDAKDHYTQGHSQAVAQLAAQIGQQLGLPESELEELRLAGILHDIGKIGVPETILNKPSRLTLEEFDLMKSHAPLGDKILEPLKLKAIERIRRMVRHHHERIDGRGYPDGLGGEEIPLGARILTIADCFDTMISERTYKRAQPLEEVVEEIRRGRGTHLDPALVDAFLESLAVKGDPRRGIRLEKSPN